MNISLAGWIIRIKEDMERVIKTIHDIRCDYKGEIFDELVDSSKEAKKRAFGFMEDMNNIFADLKELKTLFLDKLKELNVMWFGDKFVENKSEEFWVKGILFKADKTLSIRDDNDNIRVIMTNIDYPLMWALIQTTLNIKSNHLF